ncbi:Na(+)/H(+) exchange regulatory cofactor NHE-RF1-like [Arapaima gigas]
MDRHHLLNSVSLPTQESKRELRPRLCNIKKGASGYGFNLHSEKSKPGQYIRAVDDDSPAQKSGLRSQDRIVQVNGVSVEGKQHSEVVAAIKAGGDETSLLVVDAGTDAFFKKCRVLPTEEHVTGVDKELGGQNLLKVYGCGRLSGSWTIQVQSTFCRHPTSLPVSPQVEKAPVDDAGLSLTMSLQQAKERAHQKRSNKRAPPMDWSKRNELFSNL